MVNIEGKVALITGASSGIGAATAIHFASLGCSIAINGRNVDKLNKTYANCVSAGLLEKNILMLIGDVTNEEFAINAVKKTIDHFGRLNILVNIAGCLWHGDLQESTLEQYDKILNTNLKSVFNFMQLCAPYLKQTQGNIVNVSSASSSQVYENAHLFSSSKAALDNLTKSVARELAKDNVRVNTVNPSIVETDIFLNTGLPERLCELIFEKSHDSQALGRIGEAIEIAKPIAFLASDDASFVTGTTFLVDGGYSLLTR